MVRADYQGAGKDRRNAEKLSAEGLDSALAREACHPEPKARDLLPPLTGTDRLVPDRPRSRFLAPLGMTPCERELLSNPP